MKYQISKIQIKDDKIIFFLFFIILFIGIFLRFFELDKRFVFDIDVMYQALYAQTIVKDFHVIWIGVSASNLGYYLGPGLVYLTAFLFKIYNSDPVILGFFASSIGVLTILSIYYISKKLYNEKTALIASGIYSFTLFISNYDRKFWPIFIPLIGIWMYYELVKTNKNINFLLLLAFLIGVSFHIHLSLILFIPFILYAIVSTLNLKNWNIYLASMTIYLIMTSPLIVYDFVHNFDNLLLPIRIFTDRKIEITSSFTFVSILNRKLQLFREFTIPSLIFLSFLFKKSDLKINYLKSIIVVFLLAMIFYPGPFQQYYLVFAFPFFALATGILLEKINSKILLVFFTMYAVFNIYSFLNIKNIKELTYKKNVIAKICPTLTGDYRLEVGEKGRDFNGWHYLFTHYCRRPANSDVDSMFGWLYQSEIKDTAKNQRIIYTNQLE
jgi:4-amino-4-deoxy-L-arabinose transferase-like glycosyltransferase